MFARIFLSFWAAIVLIAAAAVGITVLNFAAESDNNPSAVTHHAAQIYAAEGIVGLREWLRARNRAQAPHRLLIIGDDGLDILGQPLPEFLARRRARLERQGGLADSFEPPPDFPALPAGAGQPGSRDRRFINPLFSFRAESGEIYRLRFDPPPRRGPLQPPFSWELRVSLLVLALAISGLISYALARSISSPLQRLQGTVRRLTAGDLDARSGARVTARRDEIGRLGRDFDAMAERLSALLAARQQLLRDISHELRSPLARLQLALGLARQEPQHAEAQLERIEREAGRLDVLVAQVLEYARLDREPQTMQRESIDVAELVTRVVEDARFESGATEEAVTVTQLDAVRVSGDSAVLQAAIDNVLRNALLHGAPPVEVALRAAASGAALTVRDHGPGVPEGDLLQIFAPFYRVLREDRSAADGSGIGLAIAARALHLHGGDIEARNAEGGGLEVTIRFGSSGSSPA